MMHKVYRCDKCGACCRQRIIEATAVDVLREPQIAIECPILDGHGKIPPAEASWSIAVGTERRCPFQIRAIGSIVHHHCRIYPTRPNECVGFIAGEPKCQEDRAAEGLAPLAPIEVGELTMGDRIAMEVIEAEAEEGR